MTDLHKWEPVDLTSRSSRTYRMRVPGGWLYRVVTLASSMHGADVVSVAFVPEPAEDEWEGMRAKDIRKARQ